jgi:hypothetical protein
METADSIPVLVLLGFSQDFRNSGRIAAQRRSAFSGADDQNLAPGMVGGLRLPALGSWQR